MSSTETDYKLNHPVAQARFIMKEKSRAYSVVPDVVIHDERLTADALGVWVFLWSYPYEVLGSRIDLLTDRFPGANCKCLDLLIHLGYLAIMDEIFLVVTDRPNS